MEILLKDYERKLETVKQMIADDDVTDTTLHRLMVKQGMIRSFIVDIKRAMARSSDENSGLHIACVMPSFEFTYTFTDRTDASIHTEIIEAETAEEALNALHRKHNYRIEWRTTKELNGA